MKLKTLCRIAIVSALAVGISTIEAYATSPGPNASSQNNGTSSSDNGGQPGYGPWMMHDYEVGHGMENLEGYGMGPGMMWSYRGYSPAVIGILGLSDSQQKEIRDIQETLGRQQWGLMQAMHNERIRLWRAYKKEPINIDAIVDARKNISNTRLQMLRNSLEAQKKVQSVLTDEQKKKLQEMRLWSFDQYSQ